MIKSKILSKLLSLFLGSDLRMRRRVYVGVGFLLVSSLLNITLPWFLKYVVDVFSKDIYPGAIVYGFISYGVLWTVSRITTDLKQYIVYKPFARSIRVFSLQVFQKLLDLGVGYRNKNSTGSIRNAMERAESAIPNALFGLLFFLAPQFLEIAITTCILGFFYSFSYAAILFGVFSAYVLFTYLTLNKVIESQRKNNEMSKEVSRYVTDIILNMDVVSYQSGEKAVTTVCKQKLEQREKSLYSQLERVSLIGIGQSLIAGLGLVIMTIFIGQGIVKRELVVGDFVLFNGYILQVLAPLQMMGYIFREVREGMTKMEDVLDILSTESSEKTLNKESHIELVASDVEFRSVCFKYPDKKRYVLNNLNATFLSGSFVNILGENGAGKSTLTKLLYRFYDLDEGQIFVQGKDIRAIPLLSLKKLIGIVPQDVFILNDTLQANLFFGMDGTVSDSFFQEVISVTKLDLLINRLPDGLKANVGEMGATLSGGEKQRIGIARALFRKPKILILDEATSALDKAMEQIIYQYLKSLSGVTILVITHDWRHISGNDMVLFLQEGSIQPVMEHKEIINTCDNYKRKWAAQAMIEKAPLA